MNKIYHYSHLNDYYYSLSNYLKEKYTEKFVKVCIDGGFTCPNRDGTVGYGGCIFCSNTGAKEYSADKTSVSKQLIDGIERCQKKRNAKNFIAYFQNFTGTYDEIDELKKKYVEAVSDKRVGILSIATRPDCITIDILKLLTDIREQYKVDVWIELGLQTIHDNTAQTINRCYDTDVFYNSVKLLRSYSFDVIVHLMFGLPYETKEHMLQTVNMMNLLDIQGVKFHCTCIMKNTVLEKMYLSGKYTPLTLNEYIDILCDSISILKNNIVIHRLINDHDANCLVAPNWILNKLETLNEITKAVIDNNIVQGSKYSED